MTYRKYINKKHPNLWAVYKQVPEFTKNDWIYNEQFICSSDNDWNEFANHDNSDVEYFDVIILSEEDVNQLKGSNIMSYATLPIYRKYSDPKNSENWAIYEEIPPRQYLNQTVNEKLWIGNTFRWYEYSSVGDGSSKYEIRILSEKEVEDLKVSLL